MDDNAIIDLTRDNTANSDMIEIVNNIVGRSPDISRYLLTKNNWDINKVAEDFYSFGYVPENDTEELEKITAVREYLGCRLEVATYILGKCNWDVGKVLEEVSELSSLGTTIALPSVIDKPGISDDFKIGSVKELIKCSSSVAMYLLDNFGWDVEKVVEEFFDSVKDEPETLTAGTSGGISSVLKRKTSALVNNENDEAVLKKLRVTFVKNLANVRVALHDEENNMIVGDCHKCLAPQILASTESLLTCPVCKSRTCLKCSKQGHEEGEDCGFKRTRVLPSRSFDEDNELENEFRIAEGQFLRMMKQNRGKRGKKYEIKSIDVIENDKLRELFDKKREEFREKGLDDKPLLIFHGTPQANIESILKNNFDVSKVANGRAHGDGVYFSEMPEVSLGFSKDGKSLILCKVLLGNNSKEVDKTKDGAWAVVVPDVNQILPKYVINFA